MTMQGLGYAGYTRKPETSVDVEAVVEEAAHTCSNPLVYANTKADSIPVVDERDSVTARMFERGRYPAGRFAMVTRPLL